VVDTSAAEPRTRARRVGLDLALVLGVTIALELLLQLASITSDRVALVLSSGVPIALPDARLGMRGNPAAPEHDDHGWRNAQRPARVEQVAIGDSQTYGDEVGREQAWPQRLAAHSGLRTYNLALGGYGPVQYLRLVDDALALAPERVLIGLYAGNDLADAYLAVHERGLADELLPDAATRAELGAAANERGPLTAAWLATGAARRGRVKQALRQLGEPIVNHSRLFGLLHALVRVATPRRPEKRTGSRRKSWEHYARRVADLDPALLLPVPAGRSGTILTPSARAAVLDASDPRVREGERIGLAALDAAARRCGERCRLIVVAIPTKELVFADAVSAQRMQPPRVYDRLVADERALWSRVREFLARRGIELVDSLPELRAALARGDDPYPPDWNGHPNDAGNDAIALAVLRALPPGG